MPEVVKKLGRRIFFALVYAFGVLVFLFGLIIFSSEIFYGTNTQHGDCEVNGTDKMPYYNGFWDDYPCKRTSEGWVVMFLGVLPFYALSTWIMDKIGRKVLPIPSVLLLFRPLILYVLYCGSIIMATAGAGKTKMFPYDVDTDFIFRVLYGCFILFLPIFIYEFLLLIKNMRHEGKRRD